jgi:hypothetical protein
MIKPNELRLGNLFYDDDNDVSKVIAFVPHERNIVKNNFRFSEAGCIIKYDVYTDKGLEEEFTISTELASPIPLTPEWLRKFGGYKQRTPFYCIDMPLNIGEINVNPDNGVVWLRHHRVKETNLNPVSVYFVHQLQNLFFALTGEELTIKETIN